MGLITIKEIITPLYGHANDMHTASLHIVNCLHHFSPRIINGKYDNKQHALMVCPRTLHEYLFIILL